MKHFAIIVSFSLFYIAAWSQAPAIQWQKAFGGSSTDEATSIQQTSDGGFVVGGYTQSFDGDLSMNLGWTDAWILKIDSFGNIQWSKTYGGSGVESIYAIQQTSDQGYILAGFTDSQDGDVSGLHGTDKDAWVIKLDSLGNLQWQKCLGGSFWEEAWDVQQTADGGYIVAGRASSLDGDVTDPHGGFDFWIVKLGSNGNIEWQKSMGGTASDIAYGIVQTTDLGYIVAGQSSSINGDVTGQHGSSDYWIVKLNTNGVIEWQKCLGGSSADRANDIAQTQDGGFIINGITSSSNGDITGHHSGYDFWVVKLSSSGDLVWQKALGGNNEDYGQAIIQSSDGGYIVTGFVLSTGGDIQGHHGFFDSWVAKLSESGGVLWQKTIGGSKDDTSLSIVETNDNGYALAGYSWSSNGDVSGVHGQSDFWIVKLSPESSATFTPAPTPQLTLYPNPSSGSISLNAPQARGRLQLRLSDVTGRQAAVLEAENGATFHLPALSPGIYMVQATDAAGTQFVGKLVRE